MGWIYRSTYSKCPGGYTLHLKVILRYWNTVRHLRLSQTCGRVWFYLWRPNPDLRPAPNVTPGSGRWIQPLKKPPKMTAPTSFCFIGIHADLEVVGWDGGKLSKLWRYHQHYFDDLNAAMSETRRQWHSNLIDTWILQNPPGKGTGWEPYPLSLRIVNWIKWDMSGGLQAPPSRA